MEVLDGQHVTLQGVPGSGKTWAARNGLLPLFQRIIVVDSENIEFEDFKQVSVSSAIALLKSKHAFRVRVVFTGDLDTDLDRINELCRGIRSLGSKHPPSVIYFDEFTDFADANTIPKPLRSLVRTARKRHVSVIAGTQRPALMNKTMHSNARHHLYYYMNDYDAEQIKSYAPFVKENLSQIPYGSFKCLYEDPSGTVIILAPWPKYDWSNRK